MWICHVAWTSFHVAMYTPGKIDANSHVKGHLSSIFCLSRYTHLNHNAFTYNINVNNDSGTPLMGTVRIFLSPRNDERGTEMLLRDQRLLFIEMDRFVASC